MSIYGRSMGALLAICVSSGVSSAQESGETATAANADVQARAYYKVGAFDAAADEFLAAYELGKNPSHLFNAGLSYEKANLLEKATQTYERYLSEQATGEKAVEARARLLALKKKVATASQRKAEEAKTKELADRVVAIAELAREHQSSGRFAEAAKAYAEAHALSDDTEFLFDKAVAQRQGGDTKGAMVSYQQYLRRSSDGPRRSIAERRLSELDATEHPRGGQPPSGDVLGTSGAISTDSPGMSGRRKLAIGLGAAGAIGLIGGGVFSFQALGQKDDALNPSVGGCDDAFTVCNARGAELFDDAKTSALLADIGFGVGVLAGASALYLWLSDESNESRAPRALSLELVPRLAPDSVGLSLGGGF